MIDFEGSRFSPPEIAFRPVEQSDFPKLAAWLSEPHVRQFYQKMPVTLNEVAVEYGPSVRGEEPTICHLALSQGVPFAYLQCYRDTDYPEWADLIDANDGISIDCSSANRGTCTEVSVESLWPHISVGSPFPAILSRRMPISPMNRPTLRRSDAPGLSASAPCARFWKPALRWCC
jgi:hypothetical protein